MKKLILFTLSGLLLLAAGCKKNVDTTPKYFSIEPEVFSYMKFSIGTYFIYKDSATGTEDSVVVKESSVEKMYYEPCNYYYDSLTLRLSNETANPQEDWLYIIHEKNSDSNDYLTIDRVTKRSKGLVFWYPLVTTRFVNSEWQGGYIIPSMVVEGHIYENVFLFVFSGIPDSTNKNYLRTDYFWAKGIGVIKRTITTVNGTQTSTLMRSGQNQYQDKL